ncbi:MAG: protein kinase [Verrucomicrobia subdivision 3 bacterium]|nr:protein kinase [Limisphaerales bacterium]
MNFDRNFLYAVVALQADMIDSPRLKECVELCAEGTTEVGMTFPDLLVERGLIQAGDREHLEYLVHRKLQKHSGDTSASLASASNDVKRSLAALDNPQIKEWLSLSSKAKSATPDFTTTKQTSSPGQRYMLDRLHATGGIGRVWLARDIQLGRDVALKELRPEQAHNMALWARFLKEAQITGQLEHPGIVPVYELAEHPDTQQPFYTMRFVKGRTLREASRAYHRRRTEGKADSLEFQGLLNAFVLVCKTVAYAHSRGVIHRDLKGQNVIIGDFGEVVVLDWGLAKLVNEPDKRPENPVILASDQGCGNVDLTMQGQTLGTPGYMSPEQAAGRLELIDRRTDVYGLGAILYELLTGKPPFSDHETAELLRKVQAEEPTPPDQLWPDVPLTLQAACRRALAKDPKNRYSSASELAQQVEQWQEVQRKQAEEALRTSEALYHSLVESIPICVWRKDIDGRFTFANTGFYAAFHKKPEDLIGKTDYELFPPELAQKYRRDDAHVLRTGETLRVTEEQISPTGERRLVEVIKIPIYDPRAQIIGTQGIFWDVTAWKRAEEQWRAAEECKNAGS